MVRDYVDLTDPAAAPVALDQRVAGPFEMGAGDVLAVSAKTDTGVAGSHPRDARRGFAAGDEPV